MTLFIISTEYSDLVKDLLFDDSFITTLLDAHRSLPDSRVKGIITFEEGKDL